MSHISNITSLFSVGVQETKNYVQTLVGYFKQYTAWVKNSVSIPSVFLNVFFCDMSWRLLVNVQYRENVCNDNEMQNKNIHSVVDFKVDPSE